MLDSVEVARQHRPAAAQPDRRRWAALAVLCAGMLMIVLDITVVAVALPAIQRALGFSPGGLAWVMNAYQIAFAGLLLLAGRLGDLVSRRGIFLAGLAVFTAASLLCGLARNPQMLVAARFVQGIGGAMTSAVILGMIVTIFPEPRERAKAIGLYAFVASAGGSIGLLAGGVLTQAIGWHWIFFINIPIGIVTVVFAGRVLERDTGPGFGGGADVLGAVLITAALIVGVYTLVEPAGTHGWLAGQTVTLGALALALLAAFVVREATAANPLIPLRIFRSRTVSGANLIQALSTAAMFGMFFLGVLYLQRVRGYDPLHTGLAFLPMTVVMGALSMRYSERLIMRFGAAPLLVPGLIAVSAGLALFARVPVGGSYLLDVLPPTILVGAGMGSCFPALMALAMSGATDQDAGLASGLINTTAEVGAAIGLAVLATLSVGRTARLSAHGTAARAALAGGYRLGLWVAVALAAGSVIVALALLRPTRTTGTDADLDPAAELEPASCCG